MPPVSDTHPYTLRRSLRRTWRPAVVVLSSILAVACPDPNPTGAYTEVGGAGGGSGTAAGGGSGAGSAAPNGTRPDDARFKVGDGEGVELAGTFQYEGDASGRMQIDFLTQENGGPPKLVHTLQVDKVGDWKTRVPKNYGTVHIVAFIDKAGDGPSSDDPAAKSDGPVAIAEEDIAGLDLILTDDPDLGTFTPGGGGGQPSGDPPPDGPPPDGPPPDGQPGEGAAPEGAPGGAPDGAAPQPTGGDEPPAEPPPGVEAPAGDAP